MCENFISFLFGEIRIVYTRYMLYHIHVYVSYKVNNVILYTFVINEMASEFILAKFKLLREVCFQCRIVK